MAKSGSTALFQAIRSRMPDDVLEIFEPEALPISSWSHDKHVLLKLIPWNNLELTSWKQGFQQFDHRLVLVRDPRDILLSGIFFLPQNEHFGLWDQDEQLNALIKNLKAKMEQPSSRPVLSGLLPGIPLSSLSSFFGAFWTLREQIDNGCRPVFYDDVIADDLDGLWRELDLPEKPLRTDNRWGHVPRSKATGNWRRWFTETDVAELRPLLDPILEAFPEMDPNWDLAKSPLLTPAESIDYIVKTVNMTRRRLNVPEWIPNP
jgi:hypothetical protein